MAKIIIGCEESQMVCKAFRKKGFEAYSCDLQNCSGGFPQWHIKDNILNYLTNEWDLMIAFPPCTHLSSSGAAWFKEKIKSGKQQKAIEFFMKIANAPIKRIGIENPVGIMNNKFRKPDQIIQPYFFGDPFEKMTCLWLKNLPLLIHIKEITLFDNKITHVKPEERYCWIDSKTGKIKSQPKWYALASKKNNERGKIRSKTFPGIANAMAEQWSKIL